MTAKTRVPAVAGLFTMDAVAPELIGGRITATGGYVFPLSSGGADPAAPGTPVEEVRLSRTGRIWSYTNSAYAPPPPYMVTTEPFEPFAIAAVELERERMVVLGQVAAGVTVEQLAIGMEVELVLETLYEDDEHEYVVWKWRPAAGAGAATGKGS